jgi:CheY-like chemotaxis protein
MSDTLSGRRILVVEDSPLIADVLADMLRDFGCEVVGPTGNMAMARELSAEAECDAAIVDINIRGGKVFPAADTLAERGIPFLLASGYADWSMPDHLKGRPRLAKPYTAGLVRQALEDLFGREAEPPASA